MLPTAPERVRSSLERRGKPLPPPPGDHAMPMAMPAGSTFSDFFSGTMRAARTAHHESSVGYKVGVDGFPDFRHQWERLLMEQMVNYCGDELLSEDVLAANRCDLW